MEEDMTQMGVKVVIKYLVQTYRIQTKIERDLRSSLIMLKN